MPDLPPQSSEQPPAEREIQKIILPGQTEDGRHIFGVLVKRTYDVVLGATLTRAAEDTKLIAGDIPYDGPINSPVKFESDFVPYKIATDVVLHARAHAPGGTPVQELTASVIVGQHRKDILVIGNRVARHQPKREPAFTSPEPFTIMDIRYDLAYGGIDIYSDTKMPAMYPRNHLGRGYVIANTAKVVDNLPLPNIEDPRDRLTPARLCVGHFKDWDRQPMPTGLGWFMKAWRPRSLLAGIMPADRQTEATLRAAYAPLVPPEQKALWDQTQIGPMDFHYFNGAASTGLALPFLKGDERVRLINLLPQSDTGFQLPGDRPQISLDIGEGPQSPAVFLHTVMIRLEEEKVDLVWRGAAIPYPGPEWLPKMRKMELKIQ